MCGHSAVRACHGQRILKVNHEERAIKVKSELVTGLGVKLHRLCREAITDNAGQVVMPGMWSQCCIRLRCQSSPEIGPHQIKLPVGSGTLDREHRQAQRCEIVLQLIHVEPPIYGVAGARVRELKSKQWFGRKRSAAPLQANAGGGETPQVGP